MSIDEIMLFGHGDDYYQSTREIISNFSSNVWHGADLSGLREHLYRQFDRLTRYPEPEAASLRQMLAQHYGVDARRLLVTNGSITAFYLLAQAWQGACSAIAVPSFAEYEDACRLHGHRLTFFPTSVPLSEAPLDGQELCWLCNPNNPDGRLHSRDELLAWIEKHRQVFFVIDQAYADFTTAELLHPDDVATHPNLVLVQSISKAHKVPGLRIGYLVAAPEVIRRVACYLIPWSVNAVAVEAGCYILSHPEQFVLPLRAWLDETARLIFRLNEQGSVEALPTSTTFFLARLCQGKAADLKRYLLDAHGILIRDASNFRLLDERYIRLSTQTREENDALLQALAAWVRQLQ